MRLTAILSLGLLPMLVVGCRATPTAAPVTPFADEQATTEATPPAYEEDVGLEQTGYREEHDPVAAHRARKFFLQGTKYLFDPPRVDKAIHEFHLALETDPLFYKAHFKLGICYYYKGQYDLEIGEYKKCLSITPLYVPAWLNLGHAYLARDQLEEARAAYVKVLDLQPNNGVALYNLGLVEFDLGNHENAKRYLERFLENPNSGTEDMRRRAKEYLVEIERKLETKGK